MILNHKSSAWLLAGMQFILAVILTYHLYGIAGAGAVEFSQAPSWFTSLVVLNFGLAFVLGMCALFSYRLTSIFLLFALQIVCPLLFFTDLTRNPYFTQIFLLNVWVSFLWIVWLWEAYADGKFLLPKTPLDLPLFAFLLVTMLSWGLSFVWHERSFYQSMFYEGLKGWLFIVVNAIGVFYMAVTIDEKWRGRFIWATFWIGGAAAVYGLMQFYGIEQIWSKNLTPFGNRPVSTFGNPNFLSSYLMMLAPLLLAAFITTKKKFTAFVTFCLAAVIIIGVVSTMTRSTWVGMLASLALLPLSRAVRDFVRKNQRRFAVISIVIVLFLVFWPKSRLGGYANPWQRLVEIRTLKQTGSYGPWHQRVLIWSCCWMMAKDHPVFGKGWGLLELFYPYYQGRALFNPLFRNFRTHANNAHNEVIEIWSQTGFVGMGVYAWLWVVLIIFGFKCSKYFYQQNPERSVWIWAFTASAAGMFVDNFFGNVSIHFAVPAMLFWWQAGLLFSMGRSENRPPSIAAPEWHTLPIDNNGKKMLLCFGAAIFLGNGVFNYCREFQEIFYFRGFKLAKSSGYLEQARVELESAWLWYPREVNTDYELSNDYARLSQQTLQAGMKPQAETWKKKTIWGYLESLESNCGYDEIYFNLAATQTQMKWLEDDFADFTVETPRGLSRTISAKETKGAIYNYSRALAINPLSEDSYNFLGNVFMQDNARYKDKAMELFLLETRFFPRKKDAWLNLAYLQLQAKKYEDAYKTLKTAMELDPFYELTRKNLRSLLTDMKKPDDPMAGADRDLARINALIAAKDWAQLRDVAGRLVQLFPGNFQLRFMLGNSYTEMRQWDKAEVEYNEALKLEPGNLNALSNLALVIRSSGRADEAAGIYRKILEIDPKDARANEMLKNK